MHKSKRNRSGKKQAVALFDTSHDIDSGGFRCCNFSAGITLKITAMTATHQNDILFDDLSILTKLIGQKELIVPSVNTNCDCSSYYSTEDDEAINPHQITASAAATY